MDPLPYFSIETWALLCLLIGLLMLYGIWPYGVFRKLGIPGPMPLPFIGTAFWFRYGRSNFDTACFKKYGKIWGTYDGRQPMLAITDPELIKIVLVKESYSTFLNRGNFIPRGKLETSLVGAQDEKWKRIRTVLSPTFTTGKLKEMFPIIQNYAKNLLVLLQKKADRDELVNVKQTFGAYSMDVITSTSFGVNMDSINNPKDPFVQQVQKLLTGDFLSPIFILLCRLVLPSALELILWTCPEMNISVFSNESIDFFERSITKLKETRAQEGEKRRVDFLQLMIESQDSLTSHEMNGVNHTYKGLTDAEILAQATIFILAGYETVSSALSYLTYELAIHPDIQQKLQEEIDKVLPNKAPMTYEALLQIDYLDMVLSESLRLRPGAGQLQRVCKNTIELNGITIPKGMGIMIPPAILHNNPENWPEPEKFRPERFSKEVKEQINPYTYLPFGAGPRNCIGMRFALLTMKAAVASLMQHFTFQPCKETQIPLVISPKGIFRKPTKPIVLKIIHRA
ncbi:LOW QUALITY PROTEIN: cytochrome P450 3A9-like [Thamnophis elegans]|uniref:LOW QUALITY PROTEIN: cytochrome P450 3A9-like n=1 Tax=Thamnophis elegans TaxID=35005 RepID=UPI00137763AD|nr:LOW QUALITY PROTEIN: cytochrome P450 3A9-like [Thamnophis elegans]